MHAKEVHHRVPRHLLTAYDRMTAHPELDGEGIGLALEFVERAMRYGVDDADSLTREELARRIESSRVELPRGEHREAHAADWREWGSWGGRTTLARYGRRYFHHLARRRWRQVSAAELARLRESCREVIAGKRGSYEAEGAA
ncbi:hypothetical protein GBA65_07265 [Rubrobacter marinus]|uniref:Uncharacterized protein n=1 Tax=Rubrobacter marinus TaxID=2653852 RepID=A0A6G8PVW6_9ACTN|nr:hypothetical protein [Rubrobacter marinus]QIN78352.1 hypothetical protein GBA65_07265 [Rubrobacter marinus]